MVELSWFVCRRIWRFCKSGEVYDDVIRVCFTFKFSSWVRVNFSGESPHGVLPALLPAYVRSIEELSYPRPHTTTMNIRRRDMARCLRYYDE